MSAAYVRRYYGVPATRGMRVIVNGQPGVITGFSGPHIRVRFDAQPSLSRACHPTWRTEYLTTIWKSPPEETP